MEKLDILSTSEAFEDYFERFEIWVMTKEDDEDVNIVAHFLTFIGKEAYSLLRTLAMPEKPISLPYTTLKELLLDYVNYTNLECGKGGRSRKTIHEDIKNSTTLRHPNPVHTQDYADNSLRSCNAFPEDGHKFNMLFPNDSHISDESPCKSEENMMSEHNYDGKPNVVFIDANFSNDPLLRNDILNEFHENISEESNPDVIYIIYPHNAFDPCEKPAQCEARVLSELDCDYNSDDFISTAVHPYHRSTSNVYSSQCEKYVLNEVTLFITWRYKDPTLFRGGG
ncbi:unnamed protein product [Schistosoma curassoni]|uniref:Reverse transcriptase domain-containing protein n=1 Tax=Schistosoma curassoni TaxID=6186 RepID=A0A183JM64_9TREM|nr:unnamed protein product [Schistosoma curassoni]